MSPKTEPLQSEGRSAYAICPAAPVTTIRLFARSPPGGRIDMSLCLEKGGTEQEATAGSSERERELFSTYNCRTSLLSLGYGKSTAVQSTRSVKSYFKSTAGSVSFPRSRFPKASKHQPPLQYLSHSHRKPPNSTCAPKLRSGRRATEQVVGGASTDVVTGAPPEEAPKSTGRGPTDTTDLKRCKPRRWCHHLRPNSPLRRAQRDQLRRSKAVPLLTV